jgi:Zn-dependent protease/CBS domain-containing protein
MFERGSILLFRVRGVPIRAHWTLLLILPYLVFVMSVQFAEVATAAEVPPESLRTPPWLWGIVLALGLFASVLLHELAHVIVAKRFGGKVRGITLMLLGGVSHITRMPRRPRYEALTALVGPAVSIGLGVVLITLLPAARRSPELAMAAFYLGSINIVLGIFNLVPAFPMDGGRILRAVLAARLGAVRATRAAAAVGKVLAVAMAVYGLWSGNLLLVVIALFVYAGAGAEASGERAQAMLEGLSAAELVPPGRRAPETIAVDAPVAAVLPRMRELGHPALIVVDTGGAPVAVIEAGDLARVPAEARPRIAVRDLLPRLRGRHVVVGGAEPAVEAIQRAAEEGARHLVIADPGAPGGILGLVSSPEIGAALELRLAEAGEPAPA